MQAIAAAYAAGNATSQAFAQALAQAYAKVGWGCWLAGAQLVGRCSVGCFGLPAGNRGQCVAVAARGLRADMRAVEGSAVVTPGPASGWGEGCQGVRAGRKVDLLCTCNPSASKQT